MGATYQEGSRDSHSQSPVASAKYVEQAGYANLRNRGKQDDRSAVLPTNRHQAIAIHFAEAKEVGNGKVTNQEYYQSGQQDKALGRYAVIHLIFLFPGVVRQRFSLYCFEKSFVAARFRLVLY